MVIYSLQCCLILVILFNILTVKSLVIRKRSVRRNKFRTSNKACLDFCVYTNCNTGRCILDSTTCFASCVCQANFTGRWCENEIETKNTKGSLMLFMSSRQHTTSVVGKRIPSNSSENITMETVTIPDLLIGTESNNSTEDTLRNRTIGNFPTNFVSRRESWMECKETCIEDGRCVEINGSYTCSNNDFSCERGFECTNGVCFKGLTENSSTIKCVCEYGWTGTFCRQTCAKDCGMNGQCTITDKKSGTTKCVCDSHYSGPYCTVMKVRNKTIGIFQTNFVSRRESWMECKETCIEDGRCVEINGSYTCSNNDFSCGGGFECTNGVCFKGLTENSTTIKCVCEYGWTGTFCRQTCAKDCGMNGQCAITDKKSGTTKCVCDSHYSGPYCTVMKVNPVDDKVSIHWYVIGACAGVGTLLLLMLILLPYCIWKKRRSFIMKIIHYFQHYEDDDGKTYDAFISYKSSKTDQDFILKQLYPRLELEMGYKLCLHFRDFTPGDVIANNIIKAVEDSRRTIMVISQNYIESEWCRMEYQKAQHEMLKMKHKIIPIILEDISHLKTDKNLKSIINSVTYIEWPGESDSKKLERFWKQLKLSMPKKQLQGQPNTGSSISQISTSSSESSSDFKSSINGSQHQIFPSDYVFKSSIEDPRSKYKSNRIKTLLRNPFQLNISSDNFKRLSRTCSKDSGVSSPATASPSSVSPLFNKDLNPLLPRKHIDIRHNNSKGLIFKHGYQNKLTEKCGVYNITSDEGSNIPDVCKTMTKDNNGPNGYNISPTDNISTSSDRTYPSNICQTCIFKQEVSNEFINPRNTMGKSDCDTCILPNDSTDNNVGHHKIINGKIENTSNLNYNNKTKTI